ncbi:MAG: alpha/beta hydrolase [Candidatus Bathyarchaeota archaeon]|nr:alpha/beta hydrolase [Candidatus Bathyarchaeota archaeon]
MSAQTCPLPDGRKLAYATVGEGYPVVYFHGTASSRLEVLLLRELAANAPLQLIGVDRPGYGYSSYVPRRSLQGFNADVTCLADYLGFDEFAVLGWSGGGAFALAYLTCNPNRVSCAVTVAAPALPFDVSTAHNLPLAQYIMKIPKIGELAMTQLSRQLLKSNGDTQTFLATPQGKQLLRGCSKTDLAFLHDSYWVGLMYQSMTEAFRQGNAGVRAVIEEHQVFIKLWALPFEAVGKGKLWVWHGSEDKTCRVANAYEITRLVPSARLEVFGGAGHFVMFENLQRLGQTLSSNS